MRIAIIDDDLPIASSLKKKIIDLKPNFEVIIIDYAKCNFFWLDDIDLIYMDIELSNNENGMQLYSKIKKIKNDVKVIFISSFAKYCQDIFEVDPLYFLIKPIEDDKLKGSLEKAEEFFNIRNINELVFTNKDKKVKINENDILYISSDKRKVLIHTTKTTYEFYEKINPIYELLNDSFCRCHQSYIVNLKYVQIIKKKEFILKNNKNIPISQKWLLESKNSFARYMGGNL